MTRFAPPARDRRLPRWWPAFRWAVGVLWIVCGAGMIAVWIWGWSDGDLAVRDPSDRFLAWSRLALGVFFVVLGVLWLVTIRVERRRAASTSSADTRSDV